MKFENGIVSESTIPTEISLIPKSNTTSRPQYSMNPKYITIHNTGNPSADAEDNTKYIDTATGYVSWHFTVGDNIIYQELPIDETAYHAGDGSGDGNRKSIGIEISEKEGDAAEETAIKFVAQLLFALGMSVDAVKPHQHWSGKYCPRKILPHWDLFIANIASELAELNKVKPSSWAEASIDQAKELGISDGKRPHDTATREEVIVMQMRTYNAILEEIKKAGN